MNITARLFVKKNQALDSGLRGMTEVGVAVWRCGGVAKNCHSRGNGQ